MIGLLAARHTDNQHANPAAVVMARFLLSVSGMATVRASAVCGFQIA
jgi:hypothetical protein